MANVNDSPVSNSTANRHTFDYDIGGPVELGTRVTTAVAEVTDLPPEAIGESLAQTVDPDGLDRLFRPKPDGTPRTGGRLVLSLDECFVTISSDGTLTIEP